MSIRNWFRPSKATTLLRSCMPRHRQRNASARQHSLALKCLGHHRLRAAPNLLVMLFSRADSLFVCASYQGRNSIFSVRSMVCGWIMLVVVSMSIGTAHAGMIAKNVFGTFDDGTTLTGSFSGDTGLDSILDQTELFDWTFETANHTTAPWLSSIPWHTFPLESFLFDAHDDSLSFGVFAILGFSTQYTLEVDSTPTASSYLATALDPLRFAGSATGASESPLTIANVPEPSSGVSMFGLLAMVSINHLRRRGHSRLSTSVERIPYSP